MSLLDFLTAVVLPAVLPFLFSTGCARIYFIIKFKYLVNYPLDFPALLTSGIALLPRI
jgi:hypothetical protein